MSQETADIIDALVKAGRHLARRAEVAGLGETTCRHLRTAARPPSRRPGSDAGTAGSVRHDHQLHQRVIRRRQTGRSRARARAKLQARKDED